MSEEKRVANSKVVKALLLGLPSPQREPQSVRIPIVAIDEPTTPPETQIHTQASSRTTEDATSHSLRDGGACV
jgi:hypothetical protein